jgi:N-acetylglutamate synthase-like GNAT family acetyltransferase
VIAYRQATLADAPAVLSLLEEIMDHHAVAAPEPSRLAATVHSIIAAADHCFLVAEMDGGGQARHLIGMCALVFSLSTWSASPVCELQDVVVNGEHRREDVGRGLVTAAEVIARARGCSRLFLLAESWNLGAHSFYRSLGMSEKTCLYFELDLTASSAG